MAKHISNMNELAKAIQPVMMGLVNQLADETQKTLNYFLNDYYTGWTPELSKDKGFSLFGSKNRRKDGRQ